MLLSSEQDNECCIIIFHLKKNDLLLHSKEWSSIMVWMFIAKTVVNENLHIWHFVEVQTITGKNALLSVQNVLFLIFKTF